MKTRKHSLISIPARLALVLLAVALGVPSMVQAATATRAGSVLDEGQGLVELLQFTAPGHVLGFQAQGVYVVGSDHLVKVEFTETAGVAPVANQPPSSHSQSQPLGQVTYPHLWEGITLTYERATDGIARSSYVVEPGADVGQIGLRYNVPVELDGGGNLVMRLQTGRMTETAPLAWQEINGQRVPVEVAFRLLETAMGNRPSAIAHPLMVSFAVGEYDPTYALMIDPLLQWNTFLGGTGHDYGNAIAADGSGNVYVAGYSHACWQGTNPPVRACTISEQEAFASKLDTNGNLLWYTFLGDAGRDYGMGIAVDGSGNVYVVGQSNATWGAPLNGFGGTWDVFAAKLDSSGALQWSTFTGGGGDESCWGGNSIAVDGSGNVYLAAYSDRTWNWGGVAPINPHAGGGGTQDAFVAKLNNSGIYQWHTFMGAPNVDDRGHGVAVDGSGNVYVSGRIDATWDTPVNGYSGGEEAFAAKLDTNGNRLWHTFMGSGTNDQAYGVAVDGSGNVYVSGRSDATWGTPVNPHAGGNDVFAAQLDNSGALQWNTFMGGAGNDDSQGNGIALDGSGNVYVGGESSATWGTPENPHAGGNDVFAAQLDNGGALQSNTFIGGTGNDINRGIALDGSGNVYLVGYSNATWGTPVRAFDTANDAFAAKIGGFAVDTDGDGVPDATDNCPNDANPNQEDADGDGMGDVCEGTGDRDGDGIPDYLDYDPTGYFYDETDGQIIPGGQIAVTGPGVVTIVRDGSDGSYQFTTDGTAGTYTIQVTLPPGYAWSNTCLRQDPPPFDPTGGDNPTVLGNSEYGDTGFLTSNACTDYYLTFDLAAGDPIIFNNNFPLRELFTLRVNAVVSGDASGRVTSDPAGINCGGDCTEDYLDGTLVTLTAHPGVKSYLASWSGDCVSTGALTAQVTMDADKTCTATFGHPVGGIVVPVNRLGLLVPWMGLAGLVGLAALGGVVVRRRKP